MKNPDQGRKAPGRAQIGLSAFTEIQARSRCLETCCQVLYRAGRPFCGTSSRGLLLFGCVGAAHRRDLLGELAEQLGEWLAELVSNTLERVE